MYYSFQLCAVSENTLKTTCNCDVIDLAVVANNGIYLLHISRRRRKKCYLKEKRREDEGVLPIMNALTILTLLPNVVLSKTSLAMHHKTFHI